MTNIKRNASILILYAMLIGMGTYFLTRSNHGKPLQAVVPVETFRHNEKKIDDTYQSGMVALQKHDKSLQTQIQSHLETIANTQQYTQVLENRIQALMQGREETKDTATKLILCDSLEAQVTLLIDENEKKDSANAMVVQDYQQQIEVKDSTITLCETSYSEMKTELDSSLSQQQILSDDLKAQTKKLHWRNFENRLLSAGVIILSGVTATLLLTQK